MFAATDAYSKHFASRFIGYDPVESWHQLDRGVQAVQEGCVSGEGKVGICQGCSDPANLLSDHNKVITSLLYRIQARLIDASLPEFYRLLTDGTIASQEPDGREIVASMRRATLKNGLVEWYETCYCNPPLRHERATIYDRFFTDMRVQPATNPTGPDERSFWSYLVSEVPLTAAPEEPTFSGSMIRALGRNTV